MGRRRILLLLTLALTLRLASALAFPVYPLVDNTADTAIYDEGARSLARGDGYRWRDQPTAFFPIGWPLLLSGVYRLAGESTRAAQVLNVLLSMAGLIAAWALARRLHGERAATWTLGFLAVVPHQVIFPSLLMSEVAFSAFFLASLWCLSSGTRDFRRLAAAGVLMGLATLIRGPALVFPAVVVLWAWRGERRSLVASVAAGVVFALTLLLPLLPWAVRNQRVFDHWVLVANDGGMNFLMGNHEGATGARHEPAGGLPDTGDEVADDREGYRRGLQYIRENPAGFLGLLPRKLVRLAAPAPLLTYRAELRRKWSPAIAFVLMAVDQLLHVVLWGMAGLAALAWFRRRSHTEGRGPPHHGPVLALAVLGLWIAIHLAFLGGARYFFPMTPILAGLAMRRLAGDGPAQR